MEEKWNEIWGLTEKANNAFSDFLNSGLSNQMIKRLKPFVNNWNELKKKMENFDSYIMPVDTLINELPWETIHFGEAWQFWKDYLQEQHGHVMRSRAEKMALKHLEELSDSNEESACKILEFSMYVRAKSFIIPPQKKEDNNQTIKNSENGTFG